MDEMARGFMRMGKDYAASSHRNTPDNAVHRGVIFGTEIQNFVPDSLLQHVHTMSKAACRLSKPTSISSRLPVHPSIPRPEWWLNAEISPPDGVIFFRKYNPVNVIREQVITDSSSESRS